MKILHVAPSIARSYGGPTRSLAGYAAASTSDGCDVTVVAPSAPASDVHDISAIVGTTNVIVFSAAGRNAFTFSPSLLIWLRRHVRRYDVVHVHGLFNPVSSFSAEISRRAGVPLVIRPFGTLSRYTYEHRRSGLKRLWLSLLESENIRRASALHFTTGEEKREAMWHDVAIESRGHVVPPPWVDDDNGKESPSAHEGDRVVFVGRIDPIKNLEALIDAWPRVTDKVPSATLVIAGSGDDRYVRSLSERARKLGFDLELTGFLDRDEKAKLLSSAAVFVLPSHHENFGIAAVEAAAAGVPLVISRHVQLREFFERTNLGRVSDVDLHSLSAAIVSALRDTEMRTAAALTGRRIVSQHFGIEAIRPRLSEMYLAAVQNHTSSRRSAA